MINLRKLALTGLAAGTIAAGLVGPGPPAEAQNRTAAGRVAAEVDNIVVGPQRPLVRGWAEVNGLPAGTIDFKVEPSDTLITVDRVPQGIVGDYDGYSRTMVLAPGEHTVKLTAPDGQTWTRRVVIEAEHGVEVNLDANA